MALLLTGVFTCFTVDSIFKFEQINTSFKVGASAPKSPANVISESTQYDLKWRHDNALM